MKVEANATKRTGKTRKSTSRKRRRRAKSSSGPVLITGNCGKLGRNLTRLLHRQVEVLGIDRRPFDGKPKDVTHYRLDIRRKKTRDVFRSRRPTAVIHMGVMHDPRASSTEHHSWNVLGFQKLLEYVEAYEIPKLIVLSGSAVYGPSPDNAQFLTEEAPLLGSARFSGLRDLIEVDMLAQSFFWKSPRTETVILRPTHILGTVRNASSNYLRLNPIPTLLGFDPMMQVIHENDVVRAISLALNPGVRGIFNLAGPPPEPLSKIIELTGTPSLPIPHVVAKPWLKRLWKFGLSSFPSPEMDHIKYVCMVDDSRARNVLGFSPRYDAKEAVDAVFAWE